MQSAVIMSGRDRRRARGLPNFLWLTCDPDLKARVSATFQARGASANRSASFVGSARESWKARPRRRRDTRQKVEGAIVPPLVTIKEGASENGSFHPKSVVREEKRPLCS